MLSGLLALLSALSFQPALLPERQSYYSLPARLPRALIARACAEAPGSFSKGHADPIVTDREALREVQRVWALIINHRTSNEGIYSRQLGEMSVELVLTFEVEEDAQRYADMLDAQDFPESTPVLLETQQLLEFCSTGNHQLGMVKRDAVVLPPEANVKEFGWSPGVSEEGLAHSRAMGDGAAAAADEALSGSSLNEQRLNLESLLNLESATKDDDELTQ